MYLCDRCSRTCQHAIAFDVYVYGPPSLSLPFPSLPFPPSPLHRRVTDVYPTCVNTKYLPELKLRRLTFDSPLYAHQRPPPSRRASPVSIRITNVRHTREECALAPPPLPPRLERHRCSSSFGSRYLIAIAAKLSNSGRSIGGARLFGG